MCSHQGQSFCHESIGDPHVLTSDDGPSKARCKTRSFCRHIRSELGLREDSPQGEGHCIWVIMIDHESRSARKQLNRVRKCRRDDRSSGGNGVNENAGRHLVLGVIWQDNDCAGLDQAGERVDITIGGVKYDR